MRRFWRGLRDVMPHPLILAVALAVVVAVRHRAWRFLEEQAWLFKHDPDLLLEVFRGTWGLLLIGWVFLCGLWGSCRAILHDPARSDAYRDWLSRTPWRYPHPLPQGPILPVPQDLIVLAMMAAAPWGMPGLSPWDPVLAAIAIYSLTLSRSSRTLRVACLNWLLVLLAFRVRLAGFPVAAAAFVLGSLATGCWETVRRLQREDVWLLDETASMRRRLRWPYSRLGPQRMTFAFPVPLLDGLLCGLIFAIVAAVFLAAMLNNPTELQGEINLEHWRGFSLVVAALFAGMRILAYFIGMRPSTSCLGSLALGRFVHWRFDRVWLGPALTLAATGISILLLDALQVRAEVSVCVALGVAFAAVLTAPPDWEEWRLTGDIRLVPELPEPESRRSAA
ncbi:MAG: hypothetical protein KF774_12555 [Planctomyces sp.]|nr:hypothetical protein [Planctomyces sp.]